jgi:cardiolipin synthase
MWAVAVYVTWTIIQFAFVVRVLLRPNREAASRMAWLVVILVAPVVGIVAYLFLGETSIGRKRIARARQVLADMPVPDYAATKFCAHTNHHVPDRWTPVFRLGETINGFAPVTGNAAELALDSNDAIDRLCADIDAAADHVHLMFYIWLKDNNGLKVVDAVKRAAARGVTCRVMADDLGSRSMIGSKHWRSMGDAGAKLAVALRIGNPLLHPIRGRLDLRNHRKLAVIDGGISYCGSQNCADPEFLVKKKFAPWVDVLARFEGPISHQNQHIFVADWMMYAGEDITDLLEHPLGATTDGFSAQVIATGPTERASAMPEVFVTLMYAAQEKLTITTPYYVPNAALQKALYGAANRGVDTTLIVPARNDSFVVAAASRSFYRDLLLAGVTILEYEPGLLHTKSMTIDGAVTLIGSANMDRRSFDLNYENNVLIYDPAFTEAMLARQQSYAANSVPVSLTDCEMWSLPRQLWNNSLAMMGPLL